MKEKFYKPTEFQVQGVMTIAHTNQCTLTEWEKKEMFCLMRYIYSEKRDHICQTHEDLTLLPPGQAGTQKAFVLLMKSI